MLRRALSLSPRHGAGLLLATVRLYAIRAALSVVRFSRLREWAGDPARVRRSRPRWYPRLDEDELAWVVSRAARWVPGGRCLVQALSLQSLLAKTGKRSELKIGVVREEGELKAHAWVELPDGRRLLEGVDPARFTALEQLRGQS